MPFPSRGDLSNPGIEPALPVLADGFFTTELWEAPLTREALIMLESEVTQSCPTLCNPWTEAHQAPPSMEFSRQEYWSGLPFTSPGDLPNPGIESVSPALWVDAVLSESPENPSRCLKKYQLNECLIFS